MNGFPFLLKNVFRLRFIAGGLLYLKEINKKSFCYPCDSVTVLQEDNTEHDAERKFNPTKWGTVTNDKVERLYTEEWKKFFDTRENCSACLFMKNNQRVKELKNLSYNGKSIKLDNKIEHINFP